MEFTRIHPYEGEDNYIFISYAHKDSSLVFPILRHMSSKGYRIWYDEGIDPGSEWPENIATHINNCNSFIAFISNNYLNSKHCKNELNFALSNEKDLLQIYVEDVNLPLGMQMQLNSLQAIHKYTYRLEEDFFNKLFGAAILTPSLSQKAPSFYNTSLSALSTPDVSHDKMIGAYRLVHKISAGGTADAFLAVHKPSATPIILKLYRPSLVREIPFWNYPDLQNLLLSINHPNLNTIMEFHRNEGPDGQSYTVEKYIQGETLAKFLFRHPERLPYSYSSILKIVIQLLSGLEILHQAGIFHGDVSLHNIMLSNDNNMFFNPEPFAYLIDFSETNTNGSVFPNKTMLRFDSEHSPEKSVDNTIDYRSDIYEIGIVLDKLVQKRAETDADRTLRPPVPLSTEKKQKNISETNLFHIIRKATMNDPAARYESAADMRKELELVLEQFE